MRYANQPIEAPGVKVATQHVEAPNARPVVHIHPTGTSSEEARPVDHSLTSKKTVLGTAAGVSAQSEMDSEYDQCSEPGSPVGDSEDHGELSDRDISRERELDIELSEEANYWESMKGMRSFMGWYQVPEFDTSSSSLDDDPFAAVRTQLTG